MLSIWSCIVTIQRVNGLCRDGGIEDKDAAPRNGHLGRAMPRSFKRAKSHLSPLFTPPEGKFIPIRNRGKIGGSFLEKGLCVSNSAIVHRRAQFSDYVVQNEQ